MEHRSTETERALLSMRSCIFYKPLIAWPWSRGHTCAQKTRRSRKIVLKYVHNKIFLFFLRHMMTQDTQVYIEYCITSLKIYIRCRQLRKFRECASLVHLYLANPSIRTQIDPTGDTIIPTLQIPTPTWSKIRFTSSVLKKKQIK